MPKPNAAAVHRRHAHLAGWVAEALAWALLTWGIWLLSLSAIGDQDLLVGGLSSLLCGAAAAGVRRRIGAAWRPDARLFAPALLLPISIIVDAAAVLVAAWRPRHRHEQVVRIDIGARGDSSRAAARRAVVTTVVSATPASVVLDADPKSGRLTVHSLGSPGPSLQERYRTR